ncbi:MAG: hypothetical protein H0S85_06245 [Desulfovibrionaceae bacterium]|jgi:hypothetical protein|nr:hypothetical protein [Desulfovibrionaceae bacterium]
MANMDYPGPCFACSAIEGCAGGVDRQQAVQSYCKGLELELSAWKARLYDVLVADGAREAEDSIALLKSTMRELEATAERLRNECPSSLSGEEKTIGAGLERLRVHYTKALSVISPGWFGG